MLFLCIITYSRSSTFIFLFYFSNHPLNYINYDNRQFIFQSMVFIPLFPFFRVMRSESLNGPDKCNTGLLWWFLWYQFIEILPSVEVSNIAWILWFWRYFGVPSEYYCCSTDCLYVVMRLFEYFTTKNKIWFACESWNKVSGW